MRRSLVEPLEGRTLLSATIVETSGQESGVDGLGPYAVEFAIRELTTPSGNTSRQAAGSEEHSYTLPLGSFEYDDGTYAGVITITESDHTLYTTSGFSNQTAGGASALRQETVYSVQAAQDGTVTATPIGGGTTEVWYVTSTSDATTTSTTQAVHTQSGAFHSSEDTKSAVTYTETASGPGTPTSFTTFTGQDYRVMTSADPTGGSVTLVKQTFTYVFPDQTTQRSALMTLTVFKNGELRVERTLTR